LILYGIGLFVLARNWKQGIRFGLAAAAPLCLVPLYSWLCFANPFVIGYSHQSTYQTMKQGLFGIREPNCKTMIDLTLGPCRGLFFWSPFLLMAIPGYNHVYPRNRNAFWLIFLAPLVQLFVLSGYFDWKAGFTLGPRYLAPALPLLAVPAALGTQAFPRTAAVLGGLSILLTGGATLITAAPQYDSNPLLTQHWPRLLRGEFCYTLGWTLGLPAGVGVVASVICWELSLIWLWRQVQLGRAGEP